MKSISLHSIHTSCSFRTHDENNSFCPKTNFHLTITWKRRRYIVRRKFLSHRSQYFGCLKANISACVENNFSEFSLFLSHKLTQVYDKNITDKTSPLKSGKAEKNGAREWKIMNAITHSADEFRSMQCVWRKHFSVFPIISGVFLLPRMFSALFSWERKHLSA